MPRKNVLPYHLVTNQSLAANFHSPITVVTFTDNISYQINVTTTTSTGTFAVEVSNDYQEEALTRAVISAGNWNPLNLGGGTSPTVASNDTVIDISLNQLPFGAVRISYTAGTPGDGICNIYYLSKQLGG